VRVVLGSAEARLQAEGVTYAFRNERDARLTCVSRAKCSAANAIYITASRAVICGARTCRRGVSDFFHTA
jgi:hypothetical protein